MEASKHTHAAQKNKQRRIPHSSLQTAHTFIFDEMGSGKQIYSAKTETLGNSKSAIQRTNCKSQTSKWQFIKFTMRDRNRSRSNSSQESSSRPNFNNFEPSTRLFVSGMTSNTSEHEVKKAFENIGNLRDFFLKVPEDTTKRPFAFVEYGSIAEAGEAIEALNGKKMGDKMLYVKYAKPREKKDNPGFDKGQNRGPPNREERGDRPNNRPNNGGKPNFGGNRWDKGNQQEKERTPEKARNFGNRDNRDNNRDNNRFENSKREEGNTYPKREERAFGGQSKQGFAAKKETPSNDDVDY